VSSDTRATVLATILCGVAIVIQSTLLHWVALRGVKPDLALIVLVFVSVRRGSMTGQITGFASGILEDLLSLAPVGTCRVSPRGNRVSGRNW
jgi:rod shape-determining protein MreD